MQQYPEHYQEHQTITTTIETIIQQARQQQRQNHLLNSANIILTLLNDRSQQMDLQQVRQAISLCLKCIYIIYNDKFRIENQAKQATDKQEEKGQNKLERPNIYEELINTFTTINGLHQLTGLKMKILLKNTQQDHTKFYYDNIKEYFYKYYPLNFDLNEQNDSSSSSEQFAQIVRGHISKLLQFQQYAKLQRILLNQKDNSNVSWINWIKMLLVTNQYQYQYIKIMQKFTQQNNLISNNSHIQGSIIKRIQSLKQTWQTNMINVVKSQDQILQTLQQSNSYQAINTLQKLYLIGIKTTTDWDLILLIRKRVREVRQLQYIADDKNSSQNDNQNKIIIRKLKKLKGETIDELLKYLEPEQIVQQNDSDNNNTHNNTRQFRVKFKQYTKQTQTTLINLFDDLVTKSQQILDIQISGLSSVIINQVPFLSFTVRQIFVPKQLQSYCLMRQFTAIKQDILLFKQASLQDQNSPLKTDLLNAILKNFFRLYRINSFDAEYDLVIRNFCLKIKNKLYNMANPDNTLSLLFQQASLLILLTWIEGAAEYIDSLSKIFIKLKQQQTKQQTNKIFWLNLTQKIGFILANQFSTTVDKHNQSQSYFRYCINLIKTQNLQVLSGNKYNQFLRYFMVRKQKHFHKVNRQLNFKKIDAQEIIFHWFSISNMNTQNNLKNYWVKQKQTKIADYQLSIALLKLKCIRLIPKQKNKLKLQMEKQADKIVMNCLQIWQTNKDYNFNSICRIKLIKYWLARNYTAKAYIQLKKMKYYRKQDILFYSSNVIDYNTQYHQEDVNLLVNLLKKLEMLVDNYQQQWAEHIEAIFTEIMQQNEMSYLTLDAMTIIIQQILIKKIEIKQMKKQLLQDKLLDLNRNKYQPVPQKIQYESKFYNNIYQFDFQCKFNVYNYSQHYKNDRIIVYETSCENKEKLKRAKQIFEDLWTISHQSICAIQFIQPITPGEGIQSQLRMYVSLRSKELNQSDEKIIDFPRLVKKIIQTVFYLGRYIPDYILYTSRSLHLLSTSEFQINPIQSFTLKKGLRSHSQLKKSQEQLLLKIQKSFFKRLKALNNQKPKNQMYILEQYKLCLFRQYIEDVNYYKIQFHKDLQASLYHPFFWNYLEISKFIDQFQSELQYVSHKDGNIFRKSLNRKGSKAIDGDWGDGLDEEIVKEILNKQSLKSKGNMKHYKWNQRNYSQISYLVNCIRNSIHHFIENDGFGKFENVQEMVEYFMKKYPKVLAFLWQEYDTLHQQFKKMYPVK